MGAAVNAVEILTVTIESRGTMRRTAARIGVVAALALSMGVAAVNAPSARAEEPGLVSAARANNDEMNYAINLAGTNPEDLQRALALVPGAGGRRPGLVPGDRYFLRAERHALVRARPGRRPASGWHLHPLDRPDPRGPRPLL